MLPNIQYATTIDGVSIAFYTTGEGPVLFDMPVPPFSHIQYEWQLFGGDDGAPGGRAGRPGGNPVMRERMLVRYDCRGTGLSQRECADYSPQAHARDLAAVADRLGLDRFSILAPASAGPPALIFAAEQPDRVESIVLVGSWARPEHVSQIGAMIPMIDGAWDVFTETVAHMIFGWSAGPPARQYAAMIRSGVTPEVAKATLEAETAMEITALLPRVRAHALIVHLAGNTIVSADAARELAAAIPGSQMIVIDGSYGMTDGVSAAPVQHIIDAFLRTGRVPAQTPGAAPPPPPAAPGAFRTILFTDVEGSTDLTRRLGDERARDLLREHEAITRDVLRAHGGAEVKSTGDGFMASFSSATRALECAIAMQRAFAERNERGGEPVLVRIGLNAGEPIAEADDFFGTAVILASRISAQARGGEILASNVVREIAAGKGFLFADRGETVLRGFEDPLRLYEVRWRE
jgi:class 3 adenylate cyclase/pimeloyl-ACP methyl ester carboxylesterase